MAKVLSGTADEGHVSHSLGRAAARTLWAAAIVYLVGSAVDLGILWIAQRQPGLQWEFVAVTNTVDAWPRLILSVALGFAAMFVGGSRSMLVQRLLATLLLLLGLGAAALGALVVLNYLSVSGALQGGSGALVKSTAVKSLALCGLYFVLLVPAGILSLRRGRPGRS